MDHTARNALLYENQELKKNPDAIKTMTFGKMAMRIPKQDYPMLEVFFPGITPGHVDSLYQHRRLYASPAGLAYRISDHKRKGGL